jgi:hypothetical protein
MTNPCNLTDAQALALKLDNPTRYGIDNTIVITETIMVDSPVSPAQEKSLGDLCVASVSAMCCEVIGLSGH